MSKSEHMLFRIVYKKTDEWYMKRQRVTTSGTTNDNEWQRVVQRVTMNATMSDNEWYNEWKRLVQRMKANDSDFRFQNEVIMQCKTTIYSATSFSKYSVK